MAGVEKGIKIDDMISFKFNKAQNEGLKILALGAHCDDLLDTDSTSLLDNIRIDQNIVDQNVGFIAEVSANSMDSGSQMKHILRFELVHQRTQIKNYSGLAESPGFLPGNRW